MVDYVTSDDGKGIYAYIDVETLEPVYIGLTYCIGGFRQRDYTHRYTIKDFGIPFDSELQNHPDKYIMIPLVYADDNEDLNILEQFYIYTYDTMSKWNRHYGGGDFPVMSGKANPAYRHDIDDDEVKRLYVEERLSSPIIGEILGCDESTVLDRLHKMKVPIRDVSECQKGIQAGKNNASYRHDLKDEDIAYLYTIKHYSIPEIAKELQCGSTTVSRRLKKMGIKTRSISTALKEYSKKRKGVQL